jgi:glyoxalase family protein
MSSLLGLHHVTATVDDAQEDLNFCIDALGLRLVKKTVNFDNHHVYHFYYGDERGTPGTIWTTFPYKGHGVPIGRKGTGQITVTSFSVPAGSLGFWKERLSALGISVVDDEPRFGDAVITCADASGLMFELVANRRDLRRAWTEGGIPTNMAIRGLHSVTMTVASPPATVEFMKRSLGFEVIDEAANRTRLGMRGDEPGKIVEILEVPHAGAARNGLGTVHHVAFAVPTPDDQLRMREDLLQAGARVTEVRDRQYFQSIYFREPGGVLFEIATVKPGFDVDEPLADLGTNLKLPPWEEPYRKEIEAGLAPVAYRRKGAA